MNSYSTRSQLYTVDYRIKGEKDKIGPTTRRMKKNNKKEECTEIPGIAAHCTRSHSLRIPQHNSIILSPFDFSLLLPILLAGPTLCGKIYLYGNQNVINVRRSER